MRNLFVVAFLALAGLPAIAQTQVAAAGPEPTGGTTSADETLTDGAPEGFAPVEAAGVALDDFLWLNRPLVVFASTPADPAFRQQMDLLAARWQELADRDVVVIVDTDPSAMSDARRVLRPRAFMLVLMDKDGSVAQRKPAPWDVREITRAIDKMPSRREEIRVQQPGR
jgi:hypothetical protein